MLINVVKERAATENIDVKLASAKIAQELTQYRALQDTLKMLNEKIANAKALNERHENILTILAGLQNVGYRSVKDIKSLLTKQDNGERNIVDEIWEGVNQ